VSRSEGITPTNGIGNTLLRRVFEPEAGDVPTDGKKVNNGDLQSITLSKYY
jgi:hypothetical protein